MRIVIIYNDNSFSWVSSYSFLEGFTLGINRNIKVNITKDKEKSLDWKYTDDYIKNNIIKGLSEETNIKGVFWEDDKEFLRFIKLQKIINDLFIY